VVSVCEVRGQFVLDVTFRPKNLPCGCCIVVCKASQLAVAAGLELPLLLVNLWSHEKVVTDVCIPTGALQGRCMIRCKVVACQIMIQPACSLASALGSDDAKLRDASARCFTLVLMDYISHQVGVTVSVWLP